MPGVTRIDPQALADTPQIGGERTSVQFDAGDGLTAGVWEAQPYSEYFASYPEDEIMHVLEGEIEIAVPGEAPQVFGPGATFAIAQGTELTWSQSAVVRKVFVCRPRAEG